MKYRTLIFILRHPIACYSLNRKFKKLAKLEKQIIEKFGESRGQRMIDSGYRMVYEKTIEDIVRRAKDSVLEEYGLK